MSALLSARGLTIGWPGRVLASGLDLDLEPGMIVAVLGANGAGKSTLLATLAGLHPALDGGARAGNRPLGELGGSDRARALGWVGARLARPLGMTARELVALGRVPHTGWDGRLGAGDHAAVDHALRQVGAGALGDRAVAELSDGELQKVSIARVVAQQARVLLLDEPTTHLDAAHRHQLAQVLRELAKQQGRGVVFASHDLAFVLDLADWLVVVADGFFASGSPEDLALTGALDRELGGPGLILDPLTASFVAVSASPVRAVAVVGVPGARRDWTLRALRRLGVAVDPACKDQVEVGPDDWRLPDGSRAGSLDEVTRRLSD